MKNNKNMELNDEMMMAASGGTGETEDYAFNIGDSVTMIGKVGAVTGRNIWHGQKMYSVHWTANEYGPEEDQNDIPEQLLDSYWQM